MYYWGQRDSDKQYRCTYNNRGYCSILFLRPVEKEPHTYHLICPHECHSYEHWIGRVDDGKWMKGTRDKKQRSEITFHEAPKQQGLKQREYVMYQRHEQKQNDGSWIAIDNGNDLKLHANCSDKNQAATFIVDIIQYRPG